MSLKYNSKQRYKTIQGLRSFKDTLPTEAKRIISKKGKIYNETLDNWKYLVGKDLFKVSFPKSYKSSNKLSGSRLNILVKRGNEVDVEYSKKEIIKKINIFFGYHVLDDIKLNTFDGIIEESRKNTYRAKAARLLWRSATPPPAGKTGRSRPYRPRRKCCRTWPRTAAAGER